MIRVFYGDDRVKARKMAGSQLGQDFETIEGETLALGDMPSVFLGTSLFGETRAILLKDLTLNKECWDALPKYADDCSHNVVLLESKVDKRSVAYKELAKCKNVEFKEFKLAEDPNAKLVFDILDTALRGDGKKAVTMCEQIELTNDPFMFMGLMVSQAIKKLQYNNSRAPKMIKVLAQADMDMKSSNIEPWSVIKAALLKLSAL